MLRKFAALLFCVLFISANVLADIQVEPEQINSPKIYKLSLDEAIEMALNENPQLKASEIKKENYKTQLSAAKLNKGKANQTRVVVVSGGYDAIYVKGGYYVKTYENALALSDKELEQIAATISYNVTQKYFNYKNCEKLQEISEKSFELAKNSYENTLLSYELGLVSKNDLDNVELSTKRAEYMMSTYKNAFDIAKEDLKIALRKNDENCAFLLTSTITNEDYNGILESDLIKAEESRYDINSLKSNYELSEMYLNLTGLPSNSARYTSAYSNFITAEYNYKNSKDLILLGVKSAYNNITATKNDLDIATRNFSLKENDYNIAKIKFEQGIITNAELATALNTVSQAEIELENAKLANKLAVEKYKYEISIGL